MQIIAGAGPSTKIVEIFAEALSKKPIGEDYLFEVPPRSNKHAGGVQITEKYIFGRTGRPLNAEEKSRNKREIILARIPIAFAIGIGVQIDHLSLDQLKAIYMGKISNWKGVGGPNEEIVLVGREPGEAVLSEIEKDITALSSAHYDLVASKDHEVVSFLESEQGRYALGFGAEHNFRVINILGIDGYSPGIGVGLAYDAKNDDHPLVGAAMKLSQSAEWATLVERIGSLPP